MTDIKTLIGDEYLPSEIRGKCSAASVAIIEPKFDPRECLAATERGLARGEVLDPLELGPLYPRSPEAVLRWHRRGAV